MEDELDELFGQLSNNTNHDRDELNNPFDTTQHANNNITDNITELSNNNTIQGRRCTCGYMLPTEDEYYCPLPTDYCNIWSQPYRKGDSERRLSVSCFVQPLDWKVNFARQIWYYLCFSLLLLFLYPIVSTAGNHAVRYLLSMYCPRMNIWITEHLLQAEIEDNNRIREVYDEDDRRKRRTEGWISGWRLKTKCYSSKDNKNVENEEEGQTVARDHDNQNSANCDDRMCTICLLDIEEGERISDLSCKHIYHAECLGEWIIKGGAFNNNIQIFQ